MTWTERERGGEDGGGEGTRRANLVIPVEAGRANVSGTANAPAGRLRSRGFTIPRGRHPSRSRNSWRFHPSRSCVIRLMTVVLTRAFLSRYRESRVLIMLGSLSLLGAVDICVVTDFPAYSIFPFLSFPHWGQDYPFELIIKATARKRGRKRSETERKRRDTTSTTLLA